MHDYNGGNLIDKRNGQLVTVKSLGAWLKDWHKEQIKWAEAQIAKLKSECLWMATPEEVTRHDHRVEKWQDFKSRSESAIQMIEDYERMRSNYTEPENYNLELEG